MTTSDSNLVLDLLVEWQSRRRTDYLPTADQVCPDDEQMQAILRDRIEQRLRIERMIEPGPSDLVRKLDDAPPLERDINELRHSETDIPITIGRYSIERLLGVGGYGRVYLGFDDRLDRHVAIKVASLERVKSTDQEQAYLQEAKALALLDHPQIVPVYDVGSTDQYPCFIVSKYVPGKNLAEHQENGLLSITEVERITAVIAEGLHYAHTRGIVHRDIKPRNILISESGEPYLVDFGLAFSDRDSSDRNRFAGTPHYMSPEQARGEGHRVDGRSDIFCLGVVLYEMLVGRRPFQGESSAEVLSRIVSTDPKPPRQIDDRIPKELERICLKAISKRTTDRYTTARDMAEDLWYLISNENTLESVASVESGAMLEGSRTGGGNRGRNAIDAGATRNSMTNRIDFAGVVPRGLRSFEETQHQMVGRASRHFALRFSYVGLVLVLLGTGLFLVDLSIKKTHLQNAIDAVQNCTASEIPTALVKLHQIPNDAALREIDDRNQISDPVKRLHLNYARAELGRPDVAYFCSQIGVAPPDEADNLVTAFRHNPQESIQALHQTAMAFRRQSKWLHEGWVAIFLMYLGDDSVAEKMCHKIDTDKFDFEPRAQLTEALMWWSGDPLGIIDTIRRIESPVLRAAIATGLIYPIRPRSREAIEAYSPLFKKWYLTAQDVATHSASGLALLTCTMEIPTIESSTRPTPGANWHQLLPGLILIRVVPPPEPLSLPGRSDVDQVPFELCDREISVASYLGFLFDIAYPDSEKPNPPPEFEPNTLYHPAHNINLHDAILFCNWLSWKNGYSPYYQRVDPGGIQRDTHVSNVWKTNPSAKGFRLPQESEWRIACRAGSSSLAPSDFLNINVRYATVAAPNFSPCGIILPNAWGFFELSGNVAEWCHLETPTGEVKTLLQDNSFLSSPISLQVPVFTRPDSTIRLRHCGFRVARTVRD